MRQDWRPLTLVTQLGLTVVTSLVISLLLGLWLDNTLGTKPIFTLVFSLIGILAGSVGVYRLISQAISEVVEPARPTTPRDTHPEGRHRVEPGPEESEEEELESDEDRPR